MKRNISDYIVALFVITCSIVLLAALTFALSGYRLKKATRTLQINYEDVTGVKVNSEVRYAGAPAGRVIAMRHLTAQEREASANKKDAVTVTIGLNEGIPPLPVDVTATLSSDTMLSPLARTDSIWRQFPRKVEVCTRPGTARTPCCGSSSSLFRAAGNE